MAGGSGVITLAESVLRDAVVDAARPLCTRRTTISMTDEAAGAQVKSMNECWSKLIDERGGRL